MTFLKDLLTEIGKLLFIIIPLQLVGMVVLAGVLPFVARDAKQLPRFARWFDNNNPDFDGMSGYVHYKYRPEKKPADMESFKARYHWLAIRNPINWFKYNKLGFYLLPKSPKMQSGQTIGPLNVGDTEHKVGGYQYIEVMWDGKRYYQHYYIKPYKLLGRSLCVRLLIGWKIWSWTRESHVQGVFTFNPVHPFRGREK